MADVTALPNDLTKCHAMLSEHARVIATLDHALASKDCELAGKDRELADMGYLIEQQAQRLEEQKAEIAKLQAERDAALQFAFRKKIERYLADPKQFVLDFGDTPDVVDAAEGIADAALETIRSYERRKQAKAKLCNERSRPTCHGTR